MTAEEYVRTETVLMAHQIHHSLEHDEYIAIQITTALLSNNGTERRVVIAMDLCSNSTNIDVEFAKEMGLHIEETGLVETSTFSNLLPQCILTWFLLRCRHSTRKNLSKSRLSQ